MGCGTLIGLALAAGGAGASEAGAQESLSAENAAEANQLAQQAALQAKGKNIFNQSLSTSTPQTAQQQIQQGQQQALGMAQQAQQVPLGLGMPATTGLNDPTVQGQQQARTGLANDVNSAFQGYSNYPLQQSLANQQVSNQLGGLGAQSQVAASAMPAIMQQASQTGSGLQGIGQLLSAAGLVTGLGSSAGLFGGGGTAAAAGGSVLPYASINMPDGTIAAWDPVSQSYVSLGNQLISNN